MTLNPIQFNIQCIPINGTLPAFLSGPNPRCTLVRCRGNVYKMATIPGIKYDDDLPGYSSNCFPVRTLIRSDVEEEGLALK